MMMKQRKRKEKKEEKHFSQVEFHNFLLIE